MRVEREGDDGTRTDDVMQDAGDVEAERNMVDDQR